MKILKALIIFYKYYSYILDYKIKKVQKYFIYLKILQSNCIDQFVYNNKINNYTFKQYN